MTTRDIQDQLQGLYGVNVSRTLVSTVTQVVEAERKSRQTRSFDAVYPIAYIGAKWSKSVRMAESSTKRSTDINYFTNSKLYKVLSTTFLL